MVSGGAETQTLIFAFKAHLAMAGNPENIREALLLEARQRAVIESGVSSL